MLSFAIRPSVSNDADVVFNAGHSANEQHMYCNVSYTGHTRFPFINKPLKDMTSIVGQIMHQVNRRDKIQKRK